MQNKAGLDWVGNCNITLGCRGQLIQQQVYQDYIRGNIPPNVVGLKNWVQREILYNFTQTVTRQNWVITHNLGIMPSVQVYVNQPISGNEENLVGILPTDIVYNNENQLTIILPTAYVGIAQLVGRASNPDILNPRPRSASVTTETTMQLTHQGEITICTRVSTIDIPLGLVNPITGLPNMMAGLPVTITFTPSVGNPLTVGYVASNIKSRLSPWSDIDRVLFKGRVYTVRTFNIQTGNVQISNGSTVALTGITLPSSITLPLVAVNSVANTFTINTINSITLNADYSEDFTPGTNFTTNNISGSLNWTVASVLYDPVANETTIVPTGTIPPLLSLPTTIILSGSRQIVNDEVIILLGDSPFTIYDKIAGSYVDMAVVDSPGTQFDMYYNAGDLFINDTIRETIYPPIRSV